MPDALAETPRALRPFLMALVALNLMFVQLTDAVAGSWVLSLWLLAAASPLLARCQDRLWYRGLWNGGILAAFLFLLQHVLTTGVMHMLEDGLLLAALCQVHLLNNIGRRQRPDLLFFNSFLITFVTSFFSHDVSWSLCFFVYVAVLVPALQLFVVLPRQQIASAATVRAVLRDSLPRSALALAGTAVVFVLWPRDFRHEGWLGDTLRMTSPSMVAFTEEIRLDRGGVPGQSERTIMRIRPASGRPDDVPPHWRGVTFVHFDGRGWRSYQARDFGSRFATDVAWQSRVRARGASGHDTETIWTRGGAAGGAALDLRLQSLSSRRLFTPLQAATVTVATPNALLDPKADGTLALGPNETRATELRCAVRLQNAPLQQVPSPGPHALGLLLQLPEDLPQALLDLSDLVRRELPENAGDRVMAERISDWLREHRRYVLPGTNGAVRNLAEFLYGTGGGHCEYFATTLALLLRLQDIPCRVVGGYLAHEWDEEQGEIVVRQRDAHAWVEVLLGDRGWTTLDATPATNHGGTNADSWWQQLLAGISALWRDVATFDENRRHRLFAWLQELPLRLVAVAQANPLLVAALLALIAGWLRLRRRRRRQTPQPIQRLQAALRAAKVVLLPGETPRELRSRLRTVELPARERSRLETALVEHEAARYAATGRS